MGIVTHVGGAAIEERFRLYLGMHLTLVEDDTESPQPNPPQNFIDLVSEAMKVQVIPRQSFIPPPTRKLPFHYSSSLFLGS